MPPSPTPGASTDPLSALSAETVLDGRYRLLGTRSQRPDTVVWRAVDEVLGRAVAVKAFRLGSGNVTDAEAVQEAVGRASRVSDARLVRLLDVRTDDGFGYVVSEWIEAPTLTALLRGGPLPPPEAVAVVHDVAVALARAGESDAYHGSLTTDDVFVLPGGAIRVSDLEVAASIRRSWSDDPARSDVQALGALLYAAATGRWPLDEPAVLPLAPREAGRPVPPRRLESHLPRPIDGIIMRLLDPPRAGSVGRIDTAARAAEVLAGLPRRRPGSGSAEAPRRRQRWPRWAGRVLPALAVLVLGLVAWRTGSNLGEVPGQRTGAPSLNLPTGVGASAQSQSADRQPVPVRVVALRDYDPYGDGREDSPEAPLAVDDDPTTAWQTSRYRGDPHFGGLKSGVGLLVDLGESRPLTEVRAALTAAGASMQVFASDDLRIDPNSATPVGTLDNAPQNAVVPVHDARGRYWLFWLTKLPPDGGGYRVGVAELAFLAPPTS